MASTYVNDLRLEEIGTGEQSGTWGDTTNTNLELIAEAFGFGTEAITTNADTHTTTVADGATDPGRSIFLKYTGTLDSTCTITLAPNTISKLWFIHNATSGSQSIIITQGSGANVTIATGQTKAVYTDGAGSGAVVTDAFATLSIVDLLVDDDLTVVDDVAIGGLATVGGTLGVTGVLTANAGVVVDTMTLDAATLTATGDFTVDSAGDIILDADGQQIILKDGGTTFAEVYQSSNNLFIEAKISDGDILFRGNDGGSDITALTLDMSAAGAAAFNGVLTANAGVVVDEMTLDGDTLTATDTFTIDAVDDITLNSDNSGRILFGDASIIYGIASNSSSDFVLEVGTNDKDMLFKGQDNGASITALTLDMSEAGTATFNHDVKLPSGGNLFFTSGSSFSPRLSNSNSDTALSFFTNNTERFQIATDGGLHVLTPGTSNVRLGVNAGDSIVSGANENVLIGDEAGTSLVQHGINNTAVGFSALKFEDTHGYNTAIGWSTLKNLDAGANGYNTAVGADAGRGMGTGVNNTVVGAEAGHDISSGTGNTFVGRAAGDKTDDGANNVAVGYDALGANCGSENTAVGASALNAATSQENTAVGAGAGFSLSSGTANTFMGQHAGLFSTTIDGCTFIGHSAAQGIDGTKLTGHDNTVVGFQAGLIMQGACTENTILGAYAGDNLTTGNANTFIGTYVATDGTVTGDNNTCVGHAAGAALTSGDNHLFLGHDSGRSGSPGGNYTSENNNIVLGNGSIAEAHIQVDWTVASDQRDKTDFTALDLGLDFVKALAPVTYKWDKRFNYGDKTADDYDLNAQTPDGTHKEDWLDVGFKAQEVQALEEAAGYTTAAKKNLTVSTSGDGKQMGIQYSKFIPILVKAIQEQNALIEALTARVATLEG